ncbi:MAG: class I SAM-dependent methyltransferase [Actinomycetota bacterium]
MSGSISFDRAADIYDATRSLPNEAMHALIENLVTELSIRGPALEIGVGTGRIALPLVASGIDVTGIDLSGEMLARLRSKEHGTAVKIAIGDATRLPFAAGSFGGAIVCHVFHLIPNWSDAVNELARVVRKGGVVLVELGGREESPLSEISDRLMLRGDFKRRHIGLDIFNSTEAVRVLDEAFASKGGTRRDLAPVPVVERATMESVLTAFEKGTFSWTWQVPQEERVHVANEVREWARERFGPLEQAITITHQLTWRAYDLSGS